MPAPIVSVKPVHLPARDRGEDVALRVSAPLEGDARGVVVFSHGFGWSLDGYAPLTDFWAASGFVVVQPTHLDSRKRALPTDDPRRPELWRHRVRDLVRAIDGLDALVAAVPGLAGRADTSRIAVAGHSWGAQTASMLLGARMLGAPDADFTDARVRAGVLLAMAGAGGDALSPFAREHLPHMHPGFADMRAPALIVAGDADDSPLTVRGPEWLTDGYHLSPAPKALLTVFGGEHSLGGIPGDEVTETTDESPERVALLQRLTTAYLRTALDPADGAWATADPGALGRLEAK